MTDTERARADFEAHTVEHVMTVLHDDGLYRHLRCRQPGTGLFGWDVVTWPGHLAISGDLESFTFSRTDDMLGFFLLHGRGINPSYWGEKVVAGRERVRTYSRDKMLGHIREEYLDFVRRERDREPMKLLGLWKQIKADVVEDWDGGIEWEHFARDAVGRFEHDKSGFTFSSDAWEWDVTDYDWHFLRACYAIRWAAEEYRRHKTTKAAA